MKETMIAALENKGFSRWTRYGKDRLYADSKACGFDLEYYGSGNLRRAELNGEPISNSRAGKMLARTKIYIDVPTGELVVNADADEQLVVNVRAAIAEAEKETDAE